MSDPLPPPPSASDELRASEVRNRAGAPTPDIICCPLFKEGKLVA